MGCGRFRMARLHGRALLSLLDFLVRFQSSDDRLLLRHRVAWQRVGSFWGPRCQNRNASPLPRPAANAAAARLAESPSASFPCFFRALPEFRGGGNSTPRLASSVLGGRENSCVGEGSAMALEEQAPLSAGVDRRQRPTERRRSVRAECQVPVLVRWVLPTVLTSKRPPRLVWSTPTGACCC